MATKAPDRPERRGVSRGSIDLISALLWLGIGAVVVIQSRGLEYMTEFGPSAGFVPFWVGAATIILALVLLAQTLLRRGEAEALSVPTGIAARQMLLVMAGCLGFVLLADRLGFLLSIGLLFAFLLKAVEERGWKPSIATAVIGALTCWVVFELLLGMRLPLGILGLI